MRTDPETGEEVPATLGEYLKECLEMGEDNRAVQYLRGKIQQQGADQRIIAPDSQMRALLMPMLAAPPLPEQTNDHENDQTSSTDKPPTG